MQRLMNSVNNVINTEYFAAALENGRVFSSDHQTYAVILEEFEEHADEMISAADALAEFWELVKTDGCDEEKLKTLSSLDQKAMLAACEIIQVAAMARKAIITIHERRESK